MRFKATRSVALGGGYLVAIPDLPGVVEVAKFKYVVRSRTQAGR